MRTGLPCQQSWEKIVSALESLTSHVKNKSRAIDFETGQLKNQISTLNETVIRRNDKITLLELEIGHLENPSKKRRQRKKKGSAKNDGGYSVPAPPEIKHHDE